MASSGVISHAIAWFKAYYHIWISLFWHGNSRSTHLSDHAAPPTSRSNPNSWGFSVQTNRASCVSVRQKLFCQTETACPTSRAGDSAPKSQNSQSLYFQAKSPEQALKYRYWRMPCGPEFSCFHFLRLRVSILLVLHPQKKHLFVFIYTKGEQVNVQAPNSFLPI